MTQAATPTADYTPARRLAAGAGLALVIAVSTALLHGCEVGIGVISDGWVLLEIGSRGVAAAITTVLGYHYIPATQVFMAVLWTLFGTHQLGYQALNLAELALVAWCLARFGRELGLPTPVSMTAAVLLVANSAFYEISVWPTVGNFQSLAALLYLLGLIAALRAARTGRLAWVAVFALCAVLAFYTYEPAVSLLLVGPVAWALFRAPAAENEVPRRPAWLALAIACTGAAAVLAAGKLYAARHGSAALFLPRDFAELRFRAHYAVRGVLAVASLRGDERVLANLFRLGLPVVSGTAWFQVLGLSWVAALGGATWASWQRGGRAVRLLLAAAAIHLSTTSLATQMVSRHLYIAALPLCLLFATALWHLAGVLLARAPRAQRWLRARAVLVLVAVAAFLPGAQADRARAAHLTTQVSEASSHLLALVKRHAAGQADPHVVLLDMPAVLDGERLPIHAFINGLQPMIRLELQTAAAALDVELRRTQPGGAESFASGSRPISTAELRELTRDPRYLLLTWDERLLDVRPYTPPAG